MNSLVDSQMLKRFFCFVDLTSKEAREVAGLLDTIDLENGETLFRQGEPSTAVYLLISGEVQIRIEDQDRSPRTLVTLGPGAIIGEMGPLTSEPRGATCIACTDTHLAQLPYTALDTGLERGDRWATRFYGDGKVLAQRLAALNKQTLSIMTQLENQSNFTWRIAGGLRRRLPEWTF
jgi:CRP-like cAMP-binding protein